MTTQAHSAKPLLRITSLRLVSYAERVSRAKCARKVWDISGPEWVKVSDYPNAWEWTRHIHSIEPDVDALHELLTRLADAPYRIVVTGQPCREIPLDKPARRLKHADATPGKEHPATLAECSEAWLPIDIDGIPLRCPFDPFDPALAIDEVRQLLGPQFLAASCVWQISAGQRPYAATIRCRLWFLVDIAISNADRKALGLATNHRTGLKLVDTAIYQAAGIIYIVAPQFIGGDDPIPKRWGVLYGEQDAVEWHAVDTSQPSPTTDMCGYTGVRRHAPGIDGILETVGDHLGGQGFHEPLRLFTWRAVGAKILDDTIKAMARTAIERADCSRHSAEQLRRYLSAPYLDDLIQGAQRKHLAADNLPARHAITVPDPIPLSDAMVHANEIIREFLYRQEPATDVLKLTTGAGKTHAVAEAINQGLDSGTFDEHILWYAPTQEQALEVAARFGNQAVRIRGRVQDDGDGEPTLCLRPELVRATQEAGMGAHIQTVCCETGVGKERITCPHRAMCSYYKQFDNPAPVRILPHAYLTNLNAGVYHRGGYYDSEMHAYVPLDWMGKVKRLVIDESVVKELVGHNHRKMEDLVAWGGVLADLGWSIFQGKPINPIEWSARLEEEFAERCEISIPNSSPSASAESIMAQIAPFKDENNRKNYWRGLYVAMLSYLQGLTNLVWPGKSETPCLFYGWRKEMVCPEKGQYSRLILDATADETRYRTLFGNTIRFHDIPVKQNLRVVQVHDKPVGKRKLTAEKPEILPRVVAFARGLGERKTALITHKNAIETARETNWLGELKTGHFNALRGINALQDCETLVIAGRIEPSAVAMEAEARILWPSETLNLPGTYQWQRGDHGGVVGHVDPRVDSVLRSYREAEMEQAIGRLRAVRAPITKTAYILTNAPCPLSVDETIALHNVLPDYRLARLLLLGHGVAILNPRIMAAKLPDVFPSETAAKRWASHAWGLKGTATLKKEYIFDNTIGTLLRFRIEGQRGSDNRALTWHTNPAAAHAALVGLIAKPVTITEWPQIPCPATPTKAREESMGSLSTPDPITGPVRRAVIRFRLKDNPEEQTLIELSGYAAGVLCLQRTYGDRLIWVELAELEE